ncbi:MAG TPA: hypothetical protein VIG55_01220, partial [Methylosinus sp.]
REKDARTSSAPLAQKGDFSMLKSDWRKFLPFPGHWASYLLFKLIILALAAAFAWHVLNVLEVI